MTDSFNGHKEAMGTLVEAVNESRKFKAWAGKKNLLQGRTKLKIRVSHLLFSKAITKIALRSPMRVWARWESIQFLQNILMGLKFNGMGFDQVLMDPLKNSYPEHSPLFLKPDMQTYESGITKYQTFGCQPRIMN